jgi:hypothetical protein
MFFQQLKTALETLASVLNLRNIGEKILSDLSESGWENLIDSRRLAV